MTDSLHNCCRLCLSEKQDELKSVFDESINNLALPQRILQHLSVEITATDKMSTMICMDCVTKVDNWVTFRDTCVENQRKLMQLVSANNSSDVADITLHIKEEPMDDENSDSTVATSIVLPNSSVDPLLPVKEEVTHEDAEPHMTNFTDETTSENSQDSTTNTRGFSRTKKKFSAEDRKRIRREQARERRRKIKEDPQKSQEQKEKDRMRYLRRKEDKIIRTVSEMTKTELQKQRKKWREYSRDFRMRLENRLEQYHDLPEIKHNKQTKTSSRDYDRNRARERRRKIKEDPQRRQEQKLKDKIKYLRKKENKIIKPASEMTKKELRQQRKKWRQHSRNWRMRLEEKKQMEECHDLFELKEHIEGSSSDLKIEFVGVDLKVEEDDED